MRADLRHSRAGLGLAVVALLAGGTAAPARAQVFGTAQFQYQNIDEVREVVFADGSRALRRTRTEALTKSIDVRHQSYLRQNLLMDSNLRFTELTRPGSVDRTRTPAGVVRLVHPMFQLSAQHQPTSARTSQSGIGSLAGADSAGNTVTTRTSESMLIGQAGLPGGLHVNGSWTDRRREGAEGAPRQSHIARNARASMDRDRYSVYATAGDQQQKVGADWTIRSRQSQYGTGGLWRAVATPKATVTLQYDFSGSRSHPNPQFTATSTSQSALASGEWRLRPTLATSASYNWRRVETRSSRVVGQVDQDASLLGRWTPVRGATLSSGGGFRTVRRPDGAPDLQEYVTLVASGEGKVRPGWSANGTAAHTTSWDPQRGTYGTQTLSGLSRMTLSRRASLDASLSLVANNDTGAVAQRWSNAWNTRLNLQPLRTLAVVAGARGQRVGPRLLEPVSMSRGASFDVTWKPVPRADLVGNYSLNETVSTPRQLSRTWSTNLRTQLSATWQLHGAWTRVAQPRTTRGVDTIVTQDQASGRLLWQPTRWIATILSFTSTDPGKALESNRLDGTFTWSFGR